MNRHSNQLALGTILLLELMIGTALGLAFHFLLRNDTVTWIVLGVGVLISLATSLIRHDLNYIRSSLGQDFKAGNEKLAAETLHIAGLLSEIIDVECHAKAHEVIESTKKTLTILKEGYIPLDEAEFYLKTTAFIDEAAQAVSMVEPIEAVIDGRGVRKSFQNSLEKASARGVAISRIFTCADDSVPPEKLAAVTATKANGTTVKVMLLSELPTGGEFCGQDVARLNFTIFDDRTVAESFAAPGKYFGRTTTLMTEVSKYQRVFSMLDHAAHSLDNFH